MKLTIFGAVLMIAMFYYANMYLSPHEKVQIESASSICNSIISSPFQIFNGPLVRNCLRLTVENQILAAKPYVYLLGFGMFAVGIVTGPRRTIGQRYRPINMYIPNTSMSIPVREDYPNMVAICPVCMSRSPEDTKFCTECGATIRPQSLVTLRA